MSDATSEIKMLKEIIPAAELWTEGGQVFAYLPNLKFYSNNKNQNMNALLCPHSRDGYPSRLFLEQAITNKGQNWNVFSLFGKSWHACSWNGVSAEKPWSEILLDHLRVLR